MKPQTLRALLCVVFFAISVQRADAQQHDAKASASMRHVNLVVVLHGLDSVLALQHISISEVRFFGGPAVDRTVISWLSGKTSKQPVAAVDLDSVEGYRTTSGYDSIVVIGELNRLSGSSPSSPIRFTRVEKAPENDPVVNSDTPQTFWDSTVEPIIVTVGAAAIVALFFIIRS